MSERNDGRSLLHVALAVLALLVVLYSVLILARPLMGLWLVAWLFVVYLAWQFYRLAARFVAASERLADAMEARER